MKKFLTIFLVFIMLLSFTSCAQLNEEKAAARVVATVNKTDITKAEYDKYYNYYEVVYAINGQSLPAGTELAKFKENILKDYAEIHAEYLEAVELGYKADDSIYKSNVKAALDYIAQAVGEDEVEEFYKAQGTSKEKFEAFINDYYKKLSYTNLLENDFYSIMEKDENLLNYKVATVNKKPFLMEEFLYYLMQETITSYITGDEQPSTDEEVQAYLKRVINNYAELEAYYNYAAANDIKITDEEVNSKLNEINLYINLMSPDKESQEKFLNQQLLSYETYEKYSKEHAQMLVAKEKVQQELKITDYTPTEKEIQDYYDKNFASVKGKYMYAKHILFTVDKKAEAEKCAKRAKDGEDFDKLMEEYKGTEGVMEASDLGRFDNTTMVKEFSDAAFKLSAGEVSGIVKSEYGYHVIYAYKAPELKAKKAEIKEALISEYSQTETAKKIAKIIKPKVKTPKIIKNVFDVYMDSLYDKYDIELYPRRVK